MLTFWDHQFMCNRELHIMWSRQVNLGQMRTPFWANLVQQINTLWTCEPTCTTDPLYAHGNSHSLQWKSSYANYVTGQGFVVMDAGLVLPGDHTLLSPLCAPAELQPISKGSPPFVLFPPLSPGRESSLPLVLCRKRGLPFIPFQ